MNVVKYRGSPALAVFSRVRLTFAWNYPGPESGKSGLKEAWKWCAVWNEHTVASGSRYTVRWASGWLGQVEVCLSCVCIHRGERFFSIQVGYETPVVGCQHAGALRKLFLDWVGSASRCWMVHGWDNTCWKDTCNQILIHSCTTHAELMCSCGTNPPTPCSSQLILIEVSHFTRDETCNCFKPHDYDVSVILAHNVSGSSTAVKDVAWDIHTHTPTCIQRKRKRAMVTWECVSVPVSHSAPKLQQINILLLVCHSWELAHRPIKTGNN